MSKPTVEVPAVEFAADAAPAGDVVRRKGVIFRAGSYPAQQFAMSPAELKALVAEFSGTVPIDLGHPRSESPIDGKLGVLESVEASEDGTTLFGQVALPKWLEDLMGDARRLVSAKFDPITKRLQRLSLVTNPVIADTELRAAFACACGHAEHQTPEFSEDHPPMNDRTKAALAKLEAMDEEEREGVLSAILDDDIDDVAEEDEVEEEVEEQDVAAPTPAEFALQAQVNALLAKDREREAERFADSVIGVYALPTERPHLMAQHAQAARDDAAGVAEFAASKHVKSRVAAFVAGVMARPKLGLVDERVASFAAGTTILSNGVEAPDAAAEWAARKAKYLASTPEGKAALAAIAAK